MNVRTVSWLILITLSVVWGSSFILMKRGLEAFSSQQVAAMRISIAFVVLVPLLLKHYQIDLKKYWKGLLMMGFFGNFLPAFLFTAAETQISSSLAGMLNALTPLFAVIVAFLWFKIKPSSKKFSGLIVGFIAACGLILFDSGEDVFRNFSYGFLVLLATMSYAISANAIKRYLYDLNSVKATVWAFCFTGPPALIYLLVGTDFITRVQNHPGAGPALLYIAILAVVGTAVAVVLFNILIKNAGVLFASSCTYLIPVVAILWGIFDGETVNGAQFLSMGAVILSVNLINRD